MCHCHTSHSQLPEKTGGCQGTHLFVSDTRVPFPLPLRRSPRPQASSQLAQPQVSPETVSSRLPQAPQAPSPSACDCPGGRCFHLPDFTDERHGSEMAQQLLETQLLCGRVFESRSFWFRSLNTDGPVTRGPPQHPALSEARPSEEQVSSRHAPAPAPTQGLFLPPWPGSHLDLLLIDVVVLGILFVQDGELQSLRDQRVLHSNLQGQEIHQML